MYKLCRTHLLSTPSLLVFCFTSFGICRKTAKTLQATKSNTKLPQPMPQVSKHLAFGVRRGMSEQKKKKEKKKKKSKNEQGEEKENEEEEEAEGGRKARPAKQSGDAGRKQEVQN